MYETPLHLSLDQGESREFNWLLICWYYQLARKKIYLVVHILLQNSGSFFYRLKFYQVEGVKMDMTYYMSKNKIQLPEFTVIWLPHKQVDGVNDLVGAGREAKGNGIPNK